MLRIKTYRWLLVLCLTSFILLTGLFIKNGLTGASNKQDTMVDETVVVVVKPGDTLWSIAREHMGQEGDPRRLIYEIGRLNGLQSSLIYPGQTLLLPVCPRHRY
ncbi:MAG: LysM peptidoglycan-binding domain-containing protein [bacterium]|jgi:hypothetical protein|nr:LysM peptidoglycan-binding domain-containing protein [Bacillota bacterium]HHW54327.1 LysM peptidoglycan-binding domain-containing protein [Bacillota bacterium]